MSSYYDDPYDTETAAWRPLHFDPYLAAYAGSNEDSDRGVIGHILHTLGYLDRPRNALATAVDYAKSDDPDKTFFSGLWGGLTGETQTSWADVAGIDRPSSEDEWLPWLAKGAAHLGGDMLLDPLIVAGKLGKLSKTTDAYKAASEYLHGTSLGRFAQTGPAHMRDVYDLPLAQMRTQVNREIEPMMDLVQSNKAPEGLDLAAERYAWERKGSTGDPARDAVLAQAHGMSRDAMEEVNTLAKELGIAPVYSPIAEGGYYKNWVPRVLTDTGRRSLNKHPMGGAGQIGEASRELYLMADPTDALRGTLTAVVDDSGKPVVSKIGKEYGFNRVRHKEVDELNKAAGLHPEAKVYNIDRPGLEPFEDKMGKLHYTKGIPVQATLKDIEDSGIIKQGVFTPDTLVSYATDFINKSNKAGVLAFLNSKIMPRGKKVGIDEAIEGAAPGEMFVEVKNALEQLPKNYERLNIPGLEHIAGPKWAVRQFEKTGKTLYDPETPLGMFEQLGEKFLNTQFGRLFKDGTDWWKRNVLAHPATAAGNIISNMGLMWQNGMHPWLIPYRSAQAAAVQLGKDAEIFPDMAAKELAKQFELRGLWESTWGVTEAKDQIKQAIEGPGKIRTAVEGLPEKANIIKPVGRAVAATGETIGKMNQWMLSKAFAQGEANSKIALAIDYLKKNVQGMPTANDLDVAAEFAKNGMINYAAMTPGDKIISTVIPFWAWQRGILGHTAEQLLENPNKLANFGRSIDAIFLPPEEKDRAIMDPWMQEGGPTRGMMGVDWDTIWDAIIEGTGLDKVFPSAAGKSGVGPRQWMIGRYLPQGNLEQIFNRPADFLMSSVNPLLKVPYEAAANWSTFKDRPIDPVAQRPFLDPLISDKYSMGQTKPFGLDMPAGYEYLMSQMPGGRMLNSISDLGRSAGLWSDPYKADTSPPEAFTNFFGGMRFYPFDAAKAQQRRGRELEKVEREIKSQMKFAARKGDYAAVEHYTQALAEHAKDKQRKIGMSSE